jgi:hypothetical protein
MKNQSRSTDSNRSLQTMVYRLSSQPLLVFVLYRIYEIKIWENTNQMKQSYKKRPAQLK